MFGHVEEKKSNYKTVPKGIMKNEMSYVNFVCKMMTRRFVSVRPLLCVNLHKCITPWCYPGSALISNIVILNPYFPPCHLFDNTANAA